MPYVIFFCIEVTYLIFAHNTTSKIMYFISGKIQGILFKDTIQTISISFMAEFSIIEIFSRYIYNFIFFGCHCSDYCIQAFLVE
ncbi:hypothetical protein NC77_02535 [Janthinobacterium lividum]|nr:hypothetical protein NC77_02535 [Janthinobacterium lividum]